MIGILDSGIGGLITARKIMEQLPGYDITYFGDTACWHYSPNNPYLAYNSNAMAASFLFRLTCAQRREEYVRFSEMLTGLVMTSLLHGTPVWNPFRLFGSTPSIQIPR